MELGAFSISCRFKNCEDNFVYMFTRVYGPVLAKERKDFWDDLSVIRGLWNDPWCSWEPWINPFPCPESCRVYANIS